MKTIMCITSNQYDRDQYKDHEDFEQFYHSLNCDGTELLILEDTAMKEILSPDDVIGVHLPFVNCWVDFWLGNITRLYQEYGPEEEEARMWISRFFGGLTRNDFSEKLRQAVRFSSEYAPEYLVYHISECTAYEAVSNRYYYTDEEVIDASISFINSWCDTITESFSSSELPWLLLENLWHCGLNLQNPQLISHLLQGIHYPKVGLLLDTGHLCHCNPDLSTAVEAVSYISQIVDTLPDPSVIKGVHLHLTLNGAYMKSCQKEPEPDAAMTYQEKLEKYYPMVYQIDTHQPFLAKDLKLLLQKIQPDYLIHEILASSKEEMGTLLLQQSTSLYNTNVD